MQFDMLCAARRAAVKLARAASSGAVIYRLAAPRHGPRVKWRRVR